MLCKQPILFSFPTVGFILQSLLNLGAIDNFHKFVVVCITLFFMIKEELENANMYDCYLIKTFEDQFSMFECGKLLSS